MPESLSDLQDLLPFLSVTLAVAYFIQVYGAQQTGDYGFRLLPRNGREWLALCFHQLEFTIFCCSVALIHPGAKAYSHGPVGVISRSGGMTTEMSSTLTAAGLGQSTAVSIGGDAIIGSTYAELMPLFEADESTQAIVIYTEPGGRMEAELARWVTENDSRLPIVAFMAGRFMDEMPGMSFGHAGTIVEGKEDTAAEKIARLASAGIVVAEEIAQIPDLVKERIGVRA